MYKTKLKNSDDVTSLKMCNLFNIFLIACCNLCCWIKKEKTSLELIMNVYLCVLHKKQNTFYRFENTTETKPQHRSVRHVCTETMAVPTCLLKRLMWLNKYNNKQLNLISLCQFTKNLLLIDLVLSIFCWIFVQHKASFFIAILHLLPNEGKNKLKIIKK